MKYRVQWNNMQKAELEHKINNLVKKLQAEDKPTLAEVIQSTWNMAIGDYSESLFAYRAPTEMEPELIEAFRTELQATGYGPEEISRTMSDLETYRTIQTMHHSEIVPPSRPFCVDWMCTRGLPAGRPYVIGAFSGVPFSNKSRPGRIAVNDQEINFIPKTDQDALVYSAKILDKTKQTYESLPAELKWLIPEPQNSEFFSRWAARSNSVVLERILEHPIVTLDINRVITRYLMAVLPNPDHAIHKILLEPTTTQRVLDAFGRNMHFFYTPYETGKYTKQESLYYLDGYGYSGDHQQYPNTLEEIIAGLRNDQLCPATFLVFTVLSFLNDFQCFGSFVQVEYLTKFKATLIEAKIIDRDLSNVPTSMLTTCMFPSNPSFHALDCITKQSVIPGKNRDLLGEYYLPIWEQNLYYTNKQT